MLDLVYPAAGTFLYLTYPWSGPTFMTVHNFGLSLYSLGTFTSLATAIWSQPVVYGTAYYMSDPWINQLIYVFYLSKYYEYFDTFILYAKGREPSFLQKFPHVGATICWHLCWTYKVDAILYATLWNSLVHTVMYAYYGLTYYKVDLRLLKPYLTGFQMIQFLSGFSALVLWYPVETPVNKAIIGLFLTYTAVLIGLFGHFSYETYYLKKLKQG